MHNLLKLTVCAPLLVGCAQFPKDVDMKYVSPILYERYSCAELAVMATRLSGAVGQLAGKQSERAAHDATIVAVGWPIFLKGDTPLTGELSRLKGEAFAVQQAANNNNCGLDIRLIASPEPMPL